ncbi:MAG: ferredoxin:thioredoxin reductase [Planctomycetota bacterium]|jgi:ferredoxin-thioredoxin reductase catalytic subunit|nr:ferredoxin:thioredoxin reductase [Planctomycetota bacterium]
MPSPAEQKILADLTAYVAEQDFQFNPDDKIVERVVRGLATRESKTGFRYCPCRFVGADAEANKKIVCPCVYHRDEIAQNGRCHCELFVKK